MYSKYNIQNFKQYYMYMKNRIVYPLPIKPHLVANCNDKLIDLMTCMKQSKDCKVPYTLYNDCLFKKS